MIEVKLDEAIILAAEDALRLQRQDGSMPAGHNGPYHDAELPTRNTAHWLCIYSYLYETEKSEKWKVAGERALSYLMGMECRPYGKAFHCRDKEGKDKCNGLVGQAWVIEALVAAGKAFDRKECIDLAEEVFLLHSFDQNVGLWNRVEIDGERLSFDPTFNHQLWFAAAGSLLRSSEIQSQVESFINKVVRNVQLYSNGVIYHASSMGHLFDYLKKGKIFFINEIILRVKRIFSRRTLYKKSVGYHAFNLYALSMLKTKFPRNDVWLSKGIKRALDVNNKKSFVGCLDCTPFSYLYNVSGIEMAYALEVFLGDEVSASQWLVEQFSRTYSDPAHLLFDGVPDPYTSCARLYQACRLSGRYEIKLHK